MDGTRCGQIDSTGAGTAVQPHHRLVRLSLVDVVPVEQLLVGHMTVDSSLDRDPARLAHRRDQDAHGSNMFMAVADKPLERDIQYCSIGGMPAYFAIQNTLPEIQPPAQVKTPALIQSEGMVIDGDIQIEQLGRLASSVRAIGISSKMPCARVSDDSFG